MNGNYWIREGLSSWTSRAWVQTIYLLGLGLAVVVLHVAFRIPLQLHGRHGMEWMALVLIGRLSVNRDWSGSTVSLGAAGASLLPMWSFKDPLMPLLFLVPGLLIDFAFRQAGQWRSSLIFLVFAGGSAHISKPLLRGAAAAGLGLKYGFLRDGLMYGVLLHFIFGAIGGALAYLFVLGANEIRGRDET